MEKKERKDDFAHTMEIHLINALSKEYESVLWTNVKSRKLAAIRLSPVIQDALKKASSISDNVDEVIQLYADSIVHPDDKDEFLKMSNRGALMQAIKEEGSVRFRYRILVDGKVEYYQYKAVGLGEGPDYESVVIGFSNVSAQVEKENRIQEQLKQALQNAEQASIAKSTFLFNMSHDIRTPMNAILGYTKLAQRNAAYPDRVMDYLSKLEIAGEHLLQLINDVLDMSRIESGKILLNPQRVNVREVAKNVENMVAEEMHKKQLDFCVDFAEVQDMNVLCDQLRVNQVILNLLSNAMKFTPAGGKVQLIFEQGSFREDGKCYYNIYVKDTGIGMTKEFQQHAFDAFERARSSTVSNTQGTGLGLAISKGIVDMVGGTIEVESEVDKGSTFVIRLPLFILPEKEAEDIDTNGTRTRNFDGKVLLLVEDNEMNSELAKELLEDEGFVVETADDGTVAVEAIRHSLFRGKSRYDAVLMDIQMPIMDGYEATARIRELDDPALADIPIIAMTANAFEEDRHRAMEAGMNAHVSKPINMETLLDTLASLLNSYEGETPC